MSQPLYQIANDYASLAQDENFTYEHIKDTLEGIEGIFEKKAENILALIKNELALAEMLEKEAKFLAERAKRAKKKAESLKTYIAESMKTADLKTINAGVHQLSFRKGSKSLNITDHSLIPVDYVEYETTTKVDKNLIKQDLKLGKEIPGVEIVIGKDSLIIK